MPLSQSKLSNSKFQAEELLDSLDLLADSQAFQLYLQVLQSRLDSVSRLMEVEELEFRFRQHQGKARGLREALGLHRDLTNALKQESQSYGEVDNGTG